MLYAMMSFGDQWHAELFNERDESLVKHVERRTIEHLLQRGDKVLVDNTSVTAASRSAYLKIAGGTGKRTGVIFVNTPVGTCLQRLQNHEDHIPDRVVVNLSAAIELPRREEGFDQVLIVE
jgi:predicted kinase